MGNHLSGQSSPYLLQHAGNPVEWYPWCEEAFARAREENKPVFLSIGYSTCHWCHVMARESFENPEIAEILNRYFVSVKVDREERPDIDSVYMTFCQAFTGSGGWPMSIFMTAEQKPFFAGTYFPPVSGFGRIGFRDLLLTVASKWQSSKEELFKTAGDVVSSVNQNITETKDVECSEKALPRLAAKRLLESFDSANGGFGQAPKFPTPHNLLFLLLYSHIYKKEGFLETVKFTLEKMCRGGIFDQIGYGFSRYSTDAYFFVPHFEKMLYDNALLILAYGATYKASAEPLFLETAEQTAEYVFREMMGSAGGFYSAQDADSEGQEGKYYVWSYGEILEVLGDKKGKRFCEQYGITEPGNFEGKNIPNLLHGKEISDCFRTERKLLYEYRKLRGKLHLDDKILTSWNSLMISAMSMLYRLTGKVCYLDAARRAQEFIDKYLTDGKLLLVGCRGEKTLGKGFLDEYAYNIWALLSLYEVTSEKTYLQGAKQRYFEAKRQFADEKSGGYYFYGKENDSLITRPKESYDGALPSGNSVMAYCLVRLWQLTGEEMFRQEAEKQFVFLSRQAAYAPEGHSMFVFALLLFYNPPEKITVVLSKEDRREEIIRRLPLYADIKSFSQETLEYRRIHGKTTYYVCRDQMCLPPTTVFYE